MKLLIKVSLLALLIVVLLSGCGRKTNESIPKTEICGSISVSNSPYDNGNFFSSEKITVCYMNCGKKITKVFKQPNHGSTYVYVKDGLIKFENQTIFVIRTADLISMTAEN